MSFWYASFGFYIEFVYLISEFRFYIEFVFSILHFIMVLKTGPTSRSNRRPVTITIRSSHLGWKEFRLELDQLNWWSDRNLQFNFFFPLSLYPTNRTPTRARKALSRCPPPLEKHPALQSHPCDPAGTTPPNPPTTLLEKSPLLVVSRRQDPTLPAKPPSHPPH